MKGFGAGGRGWGAILTVMYLYITDSFSRGFIISLHTDGLKAIRALLCLVVVDVKINNSMFNIQSQASFVFSLLSHVGIRMKSRPTAARARTTPKLGGPQGLTS